MTRRDLRDALLMIPAAIVFLLGLWAFCVLLFTSVPG